MVESNTWEGRENLKNTKEAIKEFEREYQWDMENVARQECKKGTFRRGELLGRFTARKLFGWSGKRYDQEYWGRLKRNWRQWKGGWTSRRRILEIVREEKKKIEQEDLGLREWIEEDNNKIGNMVNPYYKL